MFNSPYNQHLSKTHFLCEDRHKFDFFMASAPLRVLIWLKKGSDEFLNKCNLWLSFSYQFLCDFYCVFIMSVHFIVPVWSIWILLVYTSFIRVSVSVDMMWRIISNHGSTNNNIVRKCFRETWPVYREMAISCYCVLFTSHWNLFYWVPES